MHGTNIFREARITKNGYEYFLRHITSLIDLHVQKVVSYSIKPSMSYWMRSVRTLALPLPYVQQCRNNSLFGHIAIYMAMWDLQSIHLHCHTCMYSNVGSTAKNPVFPHGAIHCPMWQGVHSAMRKMSYDCKSSKWICTHLCDCGQYPVKQHVKQHALD